MGMGFPVVGEGWWRMDIGADGEPQGVSIFKLATSSKFGRSLIPVPPITPINTGAAAVSKALESWAGNYQTII